MITKPFDSAVIKSYRLNVLRNRAFPDAPREGWVSPENWYTIFDDHIRSSLVCKFVDAPQFLAGELDKYANSLGLTAQHSARGTDDGYYAFHHYTSFPLDVMDTQWNNLATTVKFELQLTTQLQEVLRQLTHPLYEHRRIANQKRDDRWKWDIDSPRFRSSYLGHTLHLIEAVIVQVRGEAMKFDEEALTAVTIQTDESVNVDTSIPTSPEPITELDSGADSTEPSTVVSELSITKEEKQE